MYVAVFWRQKLKLLLNGAASNALLALSFHKIKTWREWS
jgi:hypothetical protein